MNNTQVTYLVVGAVAVLSLGAWVGLIAVPAWLSYSRLWERLVALVMSVYVLAALVLAGVVIGALVLYYYDQL